MMQTLLAGVAIGSIITALIGVAWHRASISDLQDDFDKSWKFSIEANDRLQAIINQFQTGKSGTAKLAVKIAKGDA